MLFRTSLFAFFLLLSVSLVATVADADTCETCNTKLWLAFLGNNAVESDELTITQLLNSIESHCQSNVEFSELSNELLFELFALYPEQALRALKAQGPQNLAYILQQLAAPLHEGIELEKTIKAVENVKQDELGVIKQKVLDALAQSPITFSLLSISHNWATRENFTDWKALEYFLIRTENGIEQKIEITSSFTDWEVLDENRVLALTHQSKIQIIDFTQPKAIKNVSLDIGSVDILEIAVFDGGFYFVSADAEHLVFTTDVLWRYEWAKGDYRSVAIPDSLNMSGLTCSRDGSQIVFEHTITTAEDMYDEVYQLIHFELASQNVQLLDQGLQQDAERFVKAGTARAIHFQDEHNLVYLKSSQDELNVYQMDIHTQEKSLISSLPYYVSSIAIGPEGTLTYRSKDKYLVSREWETDNFQKRVIPAETSVLGLQYY